VCFPFRLSGFPSRRHREALFSKINDVPTVYETLTAHSDAASGAAARGKSGAATTTSGGGKSGAGGTNGAKAQTGGGKANAKKQKVDPVRLLFRFPLARPSSSEEPLLFRILFSCHCLCIHLIKRSRSRKFPSSLFHPGERGRTGD